jgi:hypothetical protein
MYWSEGAKSKPWRINDRVTFINSDPTMIATFVRWLKMLNVRSDQLTYRLSIHETADIARSTEFWAGVVGVPVAQFKRASLTRHKPKTVRRNVGDAYNGCLVIDVKQSAELYRSIEGWWRGLARSVKSVDE